MLRVQLAYHLRALFDLYYIIYIIRLLHVVFTIVTRSSVHKLFSNSYMFETGIYLADPLQSPPVILAAILQNQVKWLIDTNE